jgi:hypothetical protein
VKARAIHLPSLRRLARPGEHRVVNRWMQLAAGVVAMLAIANLQYAWTLFTKPLSASLHASFIVFSLEALAVFLLLHFIDRPVLFVALSGLCFFAWGEIFSLFPAITGDLFGKKWATTNYGIVYTAKGLASIFAGPVAALASARTGSWVPVFWAMIACDLTAALLALFWLKPLAERTIKRVDHATSPGTGSVPAGAGVRAKQEP